MMNKRNRFEPGRFAAGIIAVVLIVMIPLRTKIQKEITKIETQIQTYLDEFTSGIGRDGTIRLSKYEELLFNMKDSGLICELNISVERNAEIEAQYDTYEPNDGEKPVPDKDPDGKGYTVYIPNDEIIRTMRNKGKYDLCTDDSVIITVDVLRSIGLRSLAQKLFIPGSIKKKYSSGVLYR